MNKRLVFGVIIILACLAAALTAFEDSLTAYVDFDKARQLDKNCQVMGEIVKAEVSYDASSGILRFPIADEEGDRLLVQYAGTIPGNFEQANSVVAIGRYQQNSFQAERLLVKCPSKYQGLEEQGAANPHEADLNSN